MSDLKQICGNCIFWSTNHKEHSKCKACGDTRNYFVSRDMTCPVCKSGMIYYKKDAYLCCPDCGTEIWPFNTEISDSEMIRQEFEKQLPCDRSHEFGNGLITVHSKLNGGSKSKGKSKKAAMQKKTTTQLYKELAAIPNKINVSGNRLEAALMVGR